MRSSLIWPSRSRVFTSRKFVRFDSEATLLRFGVTGGILSASDPLDSISFASLTASISAKLCIGVYHSRVLRRPACFVGVERAAAAQLVGGAGVGGFMLAGACERRDSTVGEPANSGACNKALGTGARICRTRTAE